MIIPFDAAARDKAFDRLAKAKRSLDACKDAPDDAFASHWSEFLIHTGSALNALEAGTKDTPQGRQWYGGVKAEMRDDPLLLYMFQARNGEEHNPDPTVAYQQGVVRIGEHGCHLTATGPGAMFEVGPEGVKMGNNFTVDRPISIRWTPPGSKLQPVHDPRFKKTFETPAHHFGRTLDDLEPIDMGVLYYKYVESRIVSISG